jgi:hypothetical protein
MLRKSSMLFVAVCVTLILNAQDTKLTHVLSLKLAYDAGARATAVVWHPEFKRYYAPKSGNANFSMSIFNESGKRISDDDLKAQFDVRGFWYNPTLKTLCANGYDASGWITYKLDSKGIPVDVRHDVEYMNQPNEQSVGTYDPKNNQVFFLEGQNVIVYDAARFEEVKKIKLEIAMDNEDDLNLYADDERPEHINSTVVYTGIPKGEFALLDHEHKKIHLYNKTTGKLVKKLILPSSAPTTDFHCFSYANGIYWLFDLEAKSWEGYKYSYN